MFEKEIQSEHLDEALTLKFYKHEEIDSIYETNICIKKDDNAYFKLSRTAILSDELHDDFDITNIIFVYIHYLDRFDRREKYHPDGKQHENYKKFLMNEVIPLIKEQLPINPLGEN